MNHQWNPSGDLARRWAERSDQFLEAAGHLPLHRDELRLPGLQLLATALEYRLKAYICTVRGGVPQTRDLVRLATLAAHCGLRLTADQRGTVGWFDAATEGPGDVDGAVALNLARSLCVLIDEQAAPHRG